MQKSKSEVEIEVLKEHMREEKRAYYEGYRKVFTVRDMGFMARTFGNKKALWEYLKFTYKRPPVTKKEIGQLAASTWYLSRNNFAIITTVLETKFDPDFKPM